MSRRISYAAVVVMVIALMLFIGNLAGRAQPTGNYRPDLPPAALENGCYPLPDGVAFDGFSYQVRSDGDETDESGVTRRHLRVQFNRIDVAEAQQRAARAFLDAGFVEVRGDSAGQHFRRGPESVTITAAPLEDATPNTLVRGTLNVVLPVVERQSNSKHCDNPYSTKRFDQMGAK